jgi:hypothetical protein
MTKKLLAGAETAGNWTSIAGALQGVLAFLGEPLDRPTVMGLSGHAFRIAIWTSDAGIADAESAVRFDHERALPLYESLGYAMRRVAVGAGDPERERQMREAIRQIRRSIDHKRPVAASGLQVPDFGIIKGYDDRTGVFFVSTVVSPQYGETLPLSQWPAPGHLQSVEILLPGDRRRIDRRRAEKAALTFACAYAQAGHPDGPADTAHGFLAYEHWLRGYENPGSLSRSGNARCIQTVQAARRDAAVFLRAISPSYSGAAREALEAAAAAYSEEALTFSRLATLFPFPNGGDTLSPGALAVGAISLRQALAHEQAAIRALDAVCRVLAEGV